MFLEDSENTSHLAEGAYSGGEVDSYEPAAITDTGCERELNEDRYAVVESSSGVAWMVCDGMGGQTGGELAAQLAIDAIRRDLENLPPRPPHIAIKSAVIEANRIVVLRRQNQTFSQMGTTVIAAQFLGPEVVIANVGDCRAYLVRQGAIQQLTTDHTYVQELVDSGKIKIEDALNHPQAHILTRCLGAQPALEIDISRYWIWENEVGEEGSDILVLCSDGLYSMVDDGEIANAVSSSSPSKACVQLVELAKKRGGYDNITLSIIPVGGLLKPEAPAGYNPQAYLERPSTPVSSVTSPSSVKGLVRFILILTILSTLGLLVAFLAITYMIRV